jgi:uncharacterized protein involved in propanediol utilization
MSTTRFRAKAMHDLGLHGTKVRTFASQRRLGVGEAYAHHGELLQGVFYRGNGRLSRGLVTLPMPDHGSRAVFTPGVGQNGAGESGTVTVGGEGFAKVRRAAGITLRALPGAPARGHIDITSDIRCGLGLGSSTSDVTATIRAIADCVGTTLTAEEIARLAVRAEEASDSIMIEDRVVLFAHREGTVIETLGPRLPPMVVVGCDTDPGNAVDTLDHPPARYNDREIGALQVLRATLHWAITTRDVPLLGRVATASAHINQRFLPKPHLDFLLAACQREGGCGVQVAHSGTTAGVIFDSSRPDAADAVARYVQRLEDNGLPTTNVIGAELL